MCVVQLYSTWLIGSKARRSIVIILVRVRGRLLFLVDCRVICSDVCRPQTSLDTDCEVYACAAVPRAASQNHSTCRVWHEDYEHMYRTKEEEGEKKYTARLAH